MQFSGRESLQILSFLKTTFDVEPLFWEGLIYIPHPFIDVMFKREGGDWLLEMSYEQHEPVSIRSSSLNSVFQERIRLTLKKYSNFKELWGQRVTDFTSYLIHDLQMEVKKGNGVYAYLPNSLLKDEPLVDMYDVFSEGSMCLRIFHFENIEPVLMFNIKKNQYIRVLKEGFVLDKEFLDFYVPTTTTT